MTTEILLLTEANKGLLDNVDEDVFDYPVEPAYLSAFLTDPRHSMYLAIHSQLVVGMASAFEYFHPDKPAQLFINEVGVSPAYRRKGIGRALVAKLVKMARERGCTYAWLGTGIDNQAAQACFSTLPDVENPQKFLLYEWNLEL